MKVGFSPNQSNPNPPGTRVIRKTTNYHELATLKLLIDSKHIYSPFSLANIYERKFFLIRPTLWKKFPNTYTNIFI